MRKIKISLKTTARGSSQQLLACLATWWNSPWPLRGRLIFRQKTWKIELEAPVVPTSTSLYSQTLQQPFDPETDTLSWLYVCCTPPPQSYSWLHHTNGRTNNIPPWLWQGRGSSWSQWTPPVPLPCLAHWVPLAWWLDTPSQWSWAGTARGATFAHLDPQTSTAEWQTLAGSQNGPAAM